MCSLSRKKVDFQTQLMQKMPTTSHRSRINPKDIQLFRTKATSTPDIFLAYQGWKGAM
jgi:hypothetical protein